MSKPSEASSPHSIPVPGAEVIHVTHHSVIRAWGEDRILKQCLLEDEAWRTEHEWRAMRHAGACGLSVPEAYDIVQVHGMAGIVCERLSGTALRAMLAQKWWLFFQLAGAFAKSHAAVHACPVGPLSEGAEVERMEIEAAELSSTEKRQVLSLWGRLPDNTTLCHGDFHFGNLMWSDGRWVILDWERAHAGSPLLDVAKTALLLMIAVGGRQTAVAFLMRRIFLRAYLRAYSRYARRSLVMWREHLIVRAAMMAGRPSVPGRWRYAQYVSAQLGNHHGSR